MKVKEVYTIDEEILDAKVEEEDGAGYWTNASNMWYNNKDMDIESVSQPIVNWLDKIQNQLNGLQPRSW